MSATLGYSGVLYLVASALGRIQRCWLRRSMEPGAHLPWSSRSEFASIYSILLTCESCFPETLADFDSALDKELAKAVDKTRIDPALGHLCFSHALYFLSQCLLHHPFLIRHRLQSAKAVIPPSFLRHALMSCYENATRLSQLLNTVLKRHLCVSSSTGYCAIVAGATYRLFESYDDLAIQESSRNLSKAALDFLHQAPGRWPHYAHFLSGLAVIVCRRVRKYFQGC